jgi:hypothetical protein
VSGVAICVSGAAGLEPSVSRPASAGSLYLLMSEKASWLKFTPTSGPGGLLTTPGGKFCCTIIAAVRGVKAFCALLRNAAVPAFAIALA